MQLTPETRNRLRATVFCKTEAGRAEVERRAAGLSARQRAVLILLDGQKALGEVATWLAEDDMLEAVEGLLRKGLVGIAAAPAALVAPAAARPVAQAAFSAARDMMMAAARQHLGLMAADLVRRIEHANDESQLSGVLGLWHVTLRDSKTGKPCAEGLLAQARALLA